MKTIRSILTVPGHNLHMVRCAHERGADLVAFDLEDGVPEGQKLQARQNVCAWARPGDAVRINPPGTKAGHADLEAIASIAAVTVIVPKVEESIDLVTVDSDLDGDCPVFAVIESGKAVLGIEELLQTTRPDGVIFGWADFCASIRTNPMRGERLIEHAALRVALACRAWRVPVYFGPSLNLGRERFLMGNCMGTWGFARAWGFDGQVCIHPDQIEEVNSVFSVWPSESTWSHDASELGIGPPIAAMVGRVKELVG